LSPALSGSAQCRGYGMASGLFGGTNPPRGGRTSPQVGAGAPCAKGGVSYARRDIGQDPTNCYPSLLVRGRRLALCRPLVEASGLLNVSLLQGRLCAGGRVCAHGSSGLCSLKGSYGGAWQCWDCLRGDKPSPRRQTILPASSHPQTMARMFEAWGRSRLPSLIPWGRICSLRWNPLRPSRLLRPTSRREEQDESADGSGDDDATRKDAANELNGEVLTSTSNGAAVQVGAGESLAVQGSTIIALATTGSSALSVSDGGVADVAAASTLSARGENSTALACTGTGSVACLSDSSAYASGEKCAAIAASDGAIVSMERGSLEATLGAVVRAEGPAATSLSSTHRFSRQAPLLGSAAT
jgi:hypothetical protein